MRLRGIWWNCLVFSWQPKQSLVLAVLVLPCSPLFCHSHLHSLTPFALVLVCSFWAPFICLWEWRRAQELFCGELNIETAQLSCTGTCGLQLWWRSPDFVVGVGWEGWDPGSREMAWANVELQLLHFSIYLVRLKSAPLPVHWIFNTRIWK